METTYNLIAAAILLLGFMVAAYGLRAKCLQFLHHAGLVRDNFAGQRIPCMSGIYIWLVTLLYGFIWTMIGYAANPLPETRIILGMLYPLLWYQSIIFVIGWLDDTVGSVSVKGFKGHLRAAFVDKQFTTGMLKMVGTALVAVIVVLGWGLPFQQCLIAVPLIALMTNILNLFDVRPGRAMKGFGLFAAGALMFAADPIFPIVLTFPVLWAVLMLFPLDVKGKAMLGDTGSNLLGFSAGYIAAFAAPLWMQCILLTVCIYLHWIAERSSISRLIENNAVLRWLDGIGRAHG